MKCDICGKEAKTWGHCVCLECYTKPIDRGEFYCLEDKKQKVLLIEDGSVDTDKLDAIGINYIVYRQGSQKPEVIEI